MTDTRPRFWSLARGSKTAVGTVAVLTAGAVAVWVCWARVLTAVLAIFFITVLLFLLYFLRDPERSPPSGEGLFVAPADGRVVAVGPAEESVFLGGPAIQISIFMSLLDVHVNRAPMAGRVAFCAHQPGRFLPAHRREAADQNERQLLGLEANDARIAVRQVAGALARRIVCWVSVGERLDRGQRIGLIKLGSRVDLFLPTEVEVLVALDQKVRAGETVVARALAAQSEADAE